MKKDIQERQIENFCVAIVPPDDNIEASMWDCYVINTSENQLEGMMVVSEGFGSRDGKQVETNKFRRFHNEVNPLTAIKVEPIPKEYFDLFHQFWVSFRFDGYMYDRKFLFAPGSMDELNFTNIPILNKRGVMIS